MEADAVVLPPPQPLAEEEDGIAADGGGVDPAGGTAGGLPEGGVTAADNLRKHCDATVASGRVAMVEVCGGEQASVKDVVSVR